MILNFFATIGSVLGLQVNSELQPPTCWELFVADTLLRLPVQAKRKRWTNVPQHYCNCD